MPKNSLLLFVYLAILPARICAGANLPFDDTHHSFVYDLSNQFDINWSIIAPPAPGMQKGAFHMLSAKDGVAVFSKNSKSHLCLWEGSSWRVLYKKNQCALEPIFKIHDKIWFATGDTIAYRCRLNFFDGKRIHAVPSPQANDVRTLYFSAPDDGWAGCEWGQLMKWDGRAWRLVPSFTPYHTEILFSATDASLYAKNDIPAHDCIEYFECVDNEWQKIQTLDRKEDNEHPFFLQKGMYYKARNDSLFCLQNNNWTACDLSLVPRDTLLLPIENHPDNMIWASHRGDVRSEDYYYRETRHACNDSDIISIVPMDFAEAAVNAKSFLLFSKEGDTLTITGKKSTKREKKLIGTFVAHIKNMIQGVQSPFVYKLKICSSHFPMSVSVSNNELVVKNFLGEKNPRISKFNPSVSVKIEGSEIIVESPDKELAGQVAARFEQLTRITNRDKRVFQDGIFIIQKASKTLE